MISTAQTTHQDSLKKLVNGTGFIKGGPEPLEKESHEILGSKREDRFSNPFFELVQKMCQVHFSYLLRLGNFCKGPRTLREFPQKCQKLARC